jgi:hypothetical protein
MKINFLRKASKFVVSSRAKHGRGCEVWDIIKDREKVINRI